MVLFLLSLFFVAYHFVLYPTILWFLSLLHPRADRPHATHASPSISLLVVVHNGEDLIDDKIQNCLNLQYPDGKLEIVVASDSSTDHTVDRIRPWVERGVSLFDYPVNEGKIAAINKTVPFCRGDVLVFSDADALLTDAALINLTRWFADPSVGGVCGRKIVQSKARSFVGSQSRYFSYEDFIRHKESCVASIASNEGKLYAIRRDLFRPIPEAATDDLFNALSIISQKFRFVYEPTAEAYIPAPASHPKQEITRRRRIVCRSLLGLWRMKKLFNPFEYGIYSFILFSHKLLRRMIPSLLIIIYLSNGAVVKNQPILMFFFAIQSLIYVHALAYHLRIVPKFSSLPIVCKLLSTSYYFCLGNWGTLLGVWDFLSGKRITRWEPRKAK